MSDRRSYATHKYMAAARRPGIPNPLRHFRGRGIHSPFAYALVRNVFMKRGTPDGDRTFYDALRSQGAGRRTAAELQNLFTYCGYGDFRICGKESGCGERGGSGERGGDRQAKDHFENVDNSIKLLVLTPCIKREESLYLITAAKSGGLCDVCLLSPRRDRGRLTFCRDVAMRHKGMSMENRRMIILFTRQGLNEEHIKL